MDGRYRYPTAQHEINAGVPQHICAVPPPPLIILYLEASPQRTIPSLLFLNPLLKALVTQYPLLPRRNDDEASSPPPPFLSLPTLPRISTGMYSHIG